MAMGVSNRIYAISGIARIERRPVRQKDKLNSGERCWAFYLLVRALFVNRAAAVVEEC